MTSMCCEVVTRALYGCYKSVTQVVYGCYKGVTKCKGGNGTCWSLPISVISRSVCPGLCQYNRVRRCIIAKWLKLVEMGLKNATMRTMEEKIVG
jgi:hypothetical protein